MLERKVGDARLMLKHGKHSPRLERINHVSEDYDTAPTAFVEPNDIGSQS